MKQVCRGRTVQTLGLLAVAFVLAAVVSAAAATPSSKNDRVIRGTGKADVLVGGPRAEKLYGHGGNDRLDGRGGNDTLFGGHGRDHLAGGIGNDTIFARDGERDTIACGPGRDTATVDAADVVASDCERVAPPPNGNCTVANTSGCAPGSTLSYTDQTWTCTRPLSSYGALPVKVVLDFANNSTMFGARLGEGCAGDSNPSTIDVILEVRGNGQTHGTGDDAVRIMNESPGARDIQITGRADCGKRQGGAHQDGIHAIGGTNITFVDFVIGDYDGGVATCQGAGGIVFYSGHGGTRPQNLSIVRGSFIGCNHALLNGNPPNSTGSVRDARFRAGRIVASQGICLDASGIPYFASPPCIMPPNFLSSGLTCQRWNPSLGRWVDQ